MPKEFKHIPLEIKKDDIKEDGTFSGYGSLSDKTPDSYRDIVAPGAFRETLLKNGRNRNGIPMLWQHRSNMLPGVWKSMAEDNIGLAVEGQLALKTSLGADVYEIMKLGAELGTFQLGMSIGYDAIEVEYDKENRTRTLKKIELWELSIVTHPAKIGAGVESVKGFDDLKNIRQLEDALRDSGHTRLDAQKIISIVKKSLRDSEAEEKFLRDSETNGAWANGALEAFKEINKNIN